MLMLSASAAAQPIDRGLLEEFAVQSGELVANRLPRLPKDECVMLPSGSALSGSSERSDCGLHRILGADREDPVGRVFDLLAIEAIEQVGVVVSSTVDGGLGLLGFRSAGPDEDVEDESVLLVIQADRFSLTHRGSRWRGGLEALPDRLLEVAPSEGSVGPLIVELSRDLPIGLLVDLVLVSPTLGMSPVSLREREPERSTIGGLDWLLSEKGTSYPLGGGGVERRPFDRLPPGVRLEVTHLAGKRTIRRVRAVFDRASTHFAGCRASGAPARGEVSVWFRIDGRGNVTGSRGSSRLDEPDLIACFERATSALRFGPGRGSSTARFRAHWTWAPAPVG